MPDPNMVSRQEFEMLGQQLMEMQQALQQSQEQTQMLEQSMNQLVEGMQAEQDAASKEGFFQNYEQEFGGNHEYSDRAWDMLQQAPEGTDEREFVSHLVSQMDNEMLKYLAAKGLEVKRREEGSGESVPPEMEMGGGKSPRSSRLWTWTGKPSPLSRALARWGKLAPPRAGSRKRSPRKTRCAACLRRTASERRSYWHQLVRRQRVFSLA